MCHFTVRHSTVGSRIQGLGSKGSVKGLGHTHRGLYTIPEAVECRGRTGCVAEMRLELFHSAIKVGIVSQQERTSSKPGSRRLLFITLNDDLIALGKSMGP